MELVDFDIESASSWWKKRRKKYNMALLYSGLGAFVLYAILGECLIAPYDLDFEITLFTIFFQGIAYVIMIGLANLFYNLGYFFDRKLNVTNSDLFRKRLFYFGFYFSCSLPFSIPILILIEYFLYYK